MKNAKKKTKKIKTRKATPRVKPQTLKGFRDFLPKEMRVRNYVLGVVKDVFESFGFEPLETPSLEYAQTLLGKYGEEADRLVYTFKDRGGREVAMPYDLTVPTAKVLAMYQNEIPLPFKRYQIQRVWRAEKPQKGRYREILQCDVDIFGISSPLADAEIIAVIYNILKKLGFEKFTIRVNSREVLFKILSEAKIKEREQQLAVLRSIDKITKIGEEGIKKELLKEEVTSETCCRIFEMLKTTEPDESLAEVLDLAKSLGVEEKFLKFEPTLVRGLDYYTGPIFETHVAEPAIGSITGGGRYDNLVAQLGGPNVPATGTTIGLDRISDVIFELGLLKEELKPTTQILVTIWSENRNLPVRSRSLQIAGELRSSGINTEIYLDPEASLDKQLKYANRKGIPFVAILGPEEIKENRITLKNMKTGTQKLVTKEELPEEVEK